MEDLVHCLGKKVVLVLLNQASNVKIKISKLYNVLMDI